MALVVALPLLAACSVAPERLTAGELAANARGNLARLAHEQIPVSGPITLAEAMMRALRYNLDYRVETARKALQRAKLDLSHYSLLPDVVVNSGYTSRNNYLASKSLDLATNTVDANYSTSQEQAQFSGDLTFSWDILDFGLSYMRAKQAANEYLIAQELERTAAHRLLRDVRSTFWRAATYERLLSRLNQLDARAERALVNSRKLSESRQVSRLDALSAERELVKIRKSIAEFQDGFVTAKADLAKLMNLRPGTPFRLAADFGDALPQPPSRSLDEMMYFALLHRPELRENAYRQRINYGEAKMRLLELLPSVRTYASFSWNSNSYLLNNDWITAGSTVGWNLMKLFQYPAERYVVESEAELLEMRALALSMTITTQVFVSRVKLDHARAKVKAAKDYLSVQNRLARQMRLEWEAKRAGKQKVLLEEMNAIFAQASYESAYANYQQALSELSASLGEDPQLDHERVGPIAIARK